MGPGSYLASSTFPITSKPRLPLGSYDLGVCNEFSLQLTVRHQNCDLSTQARGLTLTPSSSAPSETGRMWEVTHEAWDEPTLMSSSSLFLLTQSETLARSWWLMSLLPAALISLDKRAARSLVASGARRGLCRKRGLMDWHVGSLLVR